MTGRWSPPHHDVWRHGDVGATGWLVYNTLAGDIPLTVAGLAALTRLHRNTVSRKLRDLAGRGLAVRSASGLWTQGDAEPSEVARSGAGKRERDRARHAAERAAYSSRRRTS